MPRVAGGISTCHSLPGLELSLQDIGETEVWGAQIRALWDHRGDLPP